jgi:predicted P-loop ATPase
MEVSEETKMTMLSVIDYLNGLAWDGVPRLERWLVEYAGADDTPYVRAVSRAMLVAAVRRARQPGCSIDQIPILVGPQGCGKSSALRVLAGIDWIVDGLPIDDTIDDARKVLEETAGKWLVEIDELHGAPTSDLKAFLSRTHDAARPAYQKTTERVPRAYVIVGTSGDPNFLSDTTGNRRFWPVSVKKFDLDKLGAIRDQLWAEAGIAEAAGASIFVDATTLS